MRILGDSGWIGRQVRLFGPLRLGFANFLSHFSRVSEVSKFRPLEVSEFRKFRKFQDFRSAESRSRHFPRIGAFALGKSQFPESGREGSGIPAGSAAKCAFSGRCAWGSPISRVVFCKFPGFGSFRVSEVPKFLPFLSFEVSGLSKLRKSVATFAAILAGRAWNNPIS